MNDFDEADTCLKEALILFPNMLMPLAAKCNIQLNTEVASHTFFSTFAEATYVILAMKCTFSSTIIHFI